MLEQDEFERRLNLARERGANDQQVEALRVKYKPMVKPKDNLVVGAVKSMVKPLTDIGRDAVGGLYGAGAATFEIGQRLAFDPQNKSKTFDREIQRGLNFATPRGRAAMTDQSLAPTKQMGLGAQRGAGVASYLVPGGKTVGSAVKLGMASGFLQGVSQDNATIGSVAANTIGGGIGGGGTKVAGQAISRAGKSVTQKLPSRIMNTVFKEPLKDTRAAVRYGTKTLGEEALEKGERGLSDEIIYKNAVTRLNQFEDELQSRLVNSGESVSTDDLRAAVAPLVEEYQSAANDSAAKAIINRIDGLEAYHGTNIPVAEANKIKRSLYDEARNAYGTQSSEQMEGIKAIARALKDKIAANVDGVDDINKQLSYNGRIADSLIDRMARGGRNNMIGLGDGLAMAGALAAAPATGGASLLYPAARLVFGTTAGKTTIAQGLKKTGEVASNMGVGRMLNSPINNYAGARLGQSIGSGLSSVGESSYNENNSQYNEPQGQGSPIDVHNPNINRAVPGVNPFRDNQPVQPTPQPTMPIAPVAPQQPIQPKVVMPMEAPTLMAQGVDLKKHWVVSPDGTKIWNPYTQKAMPYNKDVWQPKQKALTEKQRSYMGAAKIGQEMIDLLDTGNVATGPVAGRLDSLASKFGVQDPDQTSLRSKIATARTVARNALLGANMSEQELNSYLDAMFDINQPTEILKQKLQTFIQDMNTLSATDTTGSFDLGGME